MFSSFYVVAISSRLLTGHTNEICLWWCWIAVSGNKSNIMDSFVMEFNVKLPGDFRRGSGGRKWGILVPDPATVAPSRSKLTNWQYWGENSVRSLSYRWRGDLCDSLHSPSNGCGGGVDRLLDRFWIWKRLWEAIAIGYNTGTGFYRPKLFVNPSLASPKGAPSRLSLGLVH
jgi:hypothetical protein